MPRSQTTTLPVTDPAGKGVWQSRSEVGTCTGDGVDRPSVTLAPRSATDAPSDEVSISMFSKVRLAVLAATVVVHGSRWATVSGAGPELPADAATNTPAS